jgi:hypothetical protein
MSAAAKNGALRAVLNKSYDTTEYLDFRSMLTIVVHRLAQLRNFATSTTLSAEQVCFNMLSVVISLAHTVLQVL